MSCITMIAAVTRSGAIGRNGGMPFHLPADLAFFKRRTMGRPIIMGRRTFESLPGGALPGRENIVVSRNEAFRPEGVRVFGSLEEALDYCKDKPEVMICGGGDIYRQAIGLADRLVITHIDDDVQDADTFFPEIEPSVWSVEQREGPVADSKKGTMLDFVTYKRGCIGK